MVTKSLNKEKIILFAILLSSFLLIGLSYDYLSKPSFEKIQKSNSEKDEVSEVKNQKVSVLVFGDVMLDRYVRGYIKENGTYELFKNVVEEIDNSDIVLANLEGPITDNDSVVTKENLQFTFPKHTAEDLSLVGIDIVSLANNHTNNFGREGLIETRNNLAAAKIAFFGDPGNSKYYLAKSLIKDGLHISFVGYSQFENPNTEEVKKVIQIEKEKGNFVVFFPHWGEEYQKDSNDNQIGIAKEVINVGADIVIGSHPHVVQNMDVYTGVPVFYSLGNFIFDQWFSNDVKEGLALKLYFENNILTMVELKPFFRERYQPRWLEGEEKNNWCKKYNKASFKIVDGNTCLLDPKFDNQES